MREEQGTDRGNDLALVEAALFLASRPLSRRALSKILDGVPLAYVDQLLEDLGSALVDSGRGVELVAEEGRALLRVKREYVDRVAHLAPQQDIPQPVLRTLAVIAYNHPATQADVVRTRGNKAYEHIHDLIERGLVRAEEEGRTLRLSVTEEFLRHFGLSTIDEFRFHVVGPTGEPPEAATQGEEVSHE
ncbi:MAG: SMC-Scp complex subunit ScpB [Candidatus Bipolaricaulota bacterium]